MLARKLDLARNGPCCLCTEVGPLRGGICAECLTRLEESRHPRLESVKAAVAADIIADNQSEPDDTSD